VGPAIAPWASCSKSQPDRNSGICGAESSEGSGSADSSVITSEKRHDRPIEVEEQVRHQLLETTHLILELLHTAHLRHAQAAELLLPPVKRLLADLQLPADFLRRNVALDLAQGEGNLLF